MNRLFLRIYLPLAATILVVLAAAFLVAFKVVPELAGEYYRNTLTGFRNELLRRGTPQSGEIASIADSMGIEARILPFRGPETGMPMAPPRPGHVFIPGLPPEWGLLVEVPVFPGGRYGHNWMTPWLFVGLLAIAEGAVLMTSLKPLRKRLSLLESAAAAIASGDLSARVETSPGGDIVDSLGRTFNGMAERTQALLASRQELLGMVAHEIRTPLARMRFTLELMRSSPAFDASRVDGMEEDLARMDSLLTELLTFNRLSRADGISPARLDLGVIASEVTEAESWNRPEIDIRIEGSASCSADPSLLARALSNLVRNAVRHATALVTVRITEESGSAIVTVADDGPGFDPRLSGRLGRPFVKGPESTGSGLGLAIVERVASLHGGSVEYSAAPGGGAAVTVRLPAA